MSSPIFNTAAASDLIQRMRAASDRPGGQRRLIAEYIVSNPGEVAMLTAAELAAKLGTSESTVIRFAKSLGYGGYPDLRRALREQVRLFIEPVERHNQARPRGKVPPALRSFEQDIGNLAATRDSLDLKSLSRAVRLVTRTRRVFVVGFRSAYAVADLLSYHLGLAVAATVQVDAAKGRRFDAMFDISDKDLLIAIAFPRYTRLTVEAARYAAERGSRIIAITDGPFSPLAKVADVLLTARYECAEFGNSLAAPIALVNAFIAELAAVRHAAVAARLAAYEDYLRSTAALTFEDAP